MSTSAAALRNRPARARASGEVAADVALTAVVAAVTLGTIGNEHGAVTRDAILLGLLATVPLLLWRHAPLAVFAITAAASAGIDLQGYDLGAGVAPTVMVFLLARLAPETRRAATVPMVAVVFVRLVVTNPAPPDRAPAADGHGIVAMRERAALAGGRLWVGTEAGAFRVEPELPAGVERP